MYLVRLPTCEVAGCPPVYGTTFGEMEGPDENLETTFVAFCDPVFHYDTGGFFEFADIQFIGVLT